MNQDNQNQQPVNPPGPVVPELPSVQPPIGPEQSPAGGTSPGGPKKKTGLIISIVVAVFITLFVAGGIIAIVIVSSNQIKKKATEESSKELSKSDSDKKPQVECVSAQDLKDNVIYDARAEQFDADNFILSELIIFKSRSDEYDDRYIAYLKFLALEDFYKNHKDKQFVIALRASFHENKEGDMGEELARQRSDKVASEMIKRGVSKDRIVVEGSKSGTRMASRGVFIHFMKEGECKINQNTPSGATK